ncbi:MCE family protein [Nocardioides stalactiti]|uniref:MCE family protein n=1 Tax=Nocardioides stalactiti TaxID=2755356 RepID=UPI0015FFBE41|nr:MCE family protein [Nocardioides stalactiti]
MRRSTGLVLVVLSVLVTTGCGFKGPSSLPLPGAIGGDDTYPVTVVLPDAANLVPKETCRTNDTVVGSVESVDLDERLRAVVVCRIKDSATIPANAVATLSETSLLGERYVALDPPDGERATGVLEPGSEIRASAERIDPDVELVLGALSQVLNGGSLGELSTITRELTTALQQSDLSDGVRQISSSVSTLANGSRRITRSLESVDRLASRLARQRRVIARTLEVLPDGIAALDRQRPRLVRAIARVAELSRTAVPLLEETRADIAADLEHLTPVLRGLAEQGDELALALERLASFPFPTNAMSTLRGDYAGAYANVPLDIDLLNQLLADSAPGSADGGPNPTGSPGGTPPGPVLPPLPLPELDVPLSLGGIADLFDLVRRETRP